MTIYYIVVHGAINTKWTIGQRILKMCFYGIPVENCFHSISWKLTMEPSEKVSKLLMLSFGNFWI